MARRLGHAWLALWVAAVAGACGLARPYMVELPRPGDRPVGHLDAIRDDMHAVVSIMAVYEREFGLPSFPVRLEFYPTEGAFVEALGAIGYEAPVARELARHMSAVAAHRRVLVNDGVLSEAGRVSRMATLAHEIGHCVQYELGGGRRGTSEQWLREGFAEWIAMAALERLRGPSMAAVRQLMREHWRASRRQAAPRLDEMMTFRQWAAFAGRTDLSPPAQAFLAVDLLIAQHGLPSVIEYFRRFATVEDPELNFRLAFGQERARFAAAVDSALGIERR